MVDKMYFVLSLVRTCFFLVVFLQNDDSGSWHKTKEKALLMLYLYPPEASSYGCENCMLFMDLAAKD